MRILERFEREAMLQHLARNTITCYRDWLVKFLRFHRDGDRWRHPRELRGPEVGAFLTHLAADRRLSASSQNQAACAIAFLYNRVLVDELGEDHLGRYAAVRAARPERLPTVLSTGEVRRVLDHGSRPTVVGGAGCAGGGDELRPRPLPRPVVVPRRGNGDARPPRGGRAWIIR